MKLPEKCKLQQKIHLRFSRCVLLCFYNLWNRRSPIQNISIPIKYPLEHNMGLWGGEGVIKGFQKRTSFKQRVPHFWVPVLKRSVVYSEILNKHMSVIVTERTIKLIHENYGFDHYLLKVSS